MPVLHQQSKHLGEMVAEVRKAYVILVIIERFKIVFDVAVRVNGHSETNPVFKNTDIFLARKIHFSQKNFEKLNKFYKNL